MLALFVFISIGVFGCGTRAPLTQCMGSTNFQATPTAIAMDVEFEICNTNDIPLQLMIYNYSVTLNGQTVYKGKTSAQQTVPQWSTTRSYIPVVIRKDEIANAETLSWQLSGTLGYVPPSAFAEALLTSGLWETTTRITASGSIPDSN